MSINHSFWRQRKTEAESNRGPSAYQPNALPLGQTGSQTARYLTRHIKLSSVNKNRSNATFCSEFSVFLKLFSMNSDPACLFRLGFCCCCFNVCTADTYRSIQRTRHAFLVIVMVMSVMRMMVIIIWNWTLKAKQDGRRRRRAGFQRTSFFLCIKQRSV